MLLEGKVAVIYGGGGRIAEGVARVFSREGAKLFLSGRSADSLERAAAGIRTMGGDVTVDVVDALDEAAVDRYVDSVVERAGKLDISFNLIALGDVQQPLTTISVDDFIQPVSTAMRTHFLTTRAAARHMTRQGDGVILLFGGGGPQTLPGLGGFKIALDAMEGLRRQWACELGEHGIRVVTIKTGGIPETIPDEFEWKQAISDSIVQGTLLNRAATLEDVGNVAAFVASDFGRTLTSTDINISCGSMVD